MTKTATPLHLLTLYEAQIRPGLEYGSHLWRGASKYSHASLDTIQKRAIRLIDDSALTDSLDSLAHRRNVSALSLYYSRVGVLVLHLGGQSQARHRGKGCVGGGLGVRRPDRFRACWTGCCPPKQN